jgi:hypothetical protein
MDFESIVVYLPDVFSVGSEIQLTAEISSDFDNAEWTISDGTRLTGKSVNHIFQRAGIYEISLSIYSEGIQVSESHQRLKVKNKFITLENAEPISANNVLYSENKIIISASVNNSNKNIYYLLDDKLNIIKKVSELEELPEQFYGMDSFGDSILSFSIPSSSEIQYYQLKSTLNNSIENQYRGNLVSYNNGFLYSRKSANGAYLIDFYNDANEKLWTKEFPENDLASSNYIFNLNNRVVYLGFSRYTDDAVIIKFKNPSVLFNWNNFSLNIEVTNREELFAFKNTSDNTINFGVYDSGKEITTLYAIDENCNTTKVNSISGRLNGSPEFCTSIGHIVFKSGGEVLKLNSEWEIVATKNLFSENSGIHQLGDNMYLIYENLPQGEVRISLVNKHFEDILF